jgi:hypothetical protein
MSSNSNDPFSPKYGITNGQQQAMQPQYGGMPVAQPKHELNGLLIPLIIAVVLLVASLIFSVWAFLGRQDYKDNSDQKSALAVKIAEQEVSSAKDKEFLEKEKKPLKTYKGPASFGTVTVQFPKTWSAFVTESSTNTTTPVDGYFAPGFVPGIQSGVGMALRLQVVGQQYSDELKKFDSLATSGKVKISPFSLKNVNNTLGSRVDGAIDLAYPDKQGSLILLPIRDKTIEISTESPEYMNDFDNIILPNLTFIP